MRMLAIAVWVAAGLAGQEITLVRVTLGFPSPTGIENAGDGSGRLFVLQQDGRIRIVRNGVLAADPFLDIRDKTRAGGERGLLGLAFPPGFATKQRFYVNYTDLIGDTVIAQYRVSGDPDHADAGSEIVLLKIAQPFENHNGGGMRFGPDGYLYIGMGDGGSAGDPLGNGQNRGVLLGKMLRVDVEGDPGRLRIPSDNPFASDTSARPEIWALGLRNPWRFSFDRATGDLWIADVGQDSWEEVDFQPASSHGGENYGWNLMEGTHCFRPGCSSQGLTPPVFEYSHAEGCSVTGGFVYRGQAAPGLRGTYVYADYCSGRIWGLERTGAGVSNRLLAEPGFNITSFGEDESGELYVANAKDGGLYRVEGSEAPRIRSGGVVNAASYAPGLTPGSLATVFAAGVKDTAGVVAASDVPLPANVGDVSVLIDGTAAPVLAVSNQNGQEQVNVQVPYEVRGRQQVQVIVKRGEVSSSAVAVSVADVQPGIFTSDGTRAVAVHAADYTLVADARPLVRGEYAFVYATGLGRADNEPATGAAARSDGLARISGDVGLTLGGVRCEVPFAGLAPGLVGVYQVNFHVPDAVPNGVEEMGITVDGVSGARVTVPVE